MGDSYNTSTEQVQLPDISMKWHKFLINFLIWVWVVFDIYNASQDYQAIKMLGENLNQLKAGVLLPVQTVLFVISAIYTIKVRFDLAKFKKKAPGELQIMFILTMVINAITIILYSLNEIPMDSSLATNFVMNISGLLFYRRYYNLRDQYFNVGDGQPAKTTSVSSGTAGSSSGVNATSASSGSTYQSSGSATGSVSFSGSASETSSYETSSETSSYGTTSGTFTMGSDSFVTSTQETSSGNTFSAGSAASVSSSGVNTKPSAPASSANKESSSGSTIALVLILACAAALIWNVYRIVDTPAGRASGYPDSISLFGVPVHFAFLMVYPIVMVIAVLIAAAVKKIWARALFLAIACDSSFTTGNWNFNIVFSSLIAPVFTSYVSVQIIGKVFTILLLALLVGYCVERWKKKA